MSQCDNEIIELSNYRIAELSNKILKIVKVSIPMGG